MGLSEKRFWVPRSTLDWLVCSCCPHVSVWVLCQAPAMIKVFRQTALIQMPQAQGPAVEKAIPHCIIYSPPSSLLGCRATPRPNTLTRGHTWIGPAKFCGALEQDKEWFHEASSPRESQQRQGTANVCHRQKDT